MLFNLNKFNKEIKAVAALKEMPDLLSVADKDRIKQKILEAIKNPVPVKAGILSWREKLFKVGKYLVPTVLGLSLIGGTAFAAGSSKPGDILYPVKIATEKVQ